MVPENQLHLYYKRGRVGDDPSAEERAEEWQDVGAAVKEFIRLFEELTGNEFEPWEREKKFQKKPLKFYPIDMVYSLLSLASLAFIFTVELIAHCFDKYCTNMVPI